MLDKTAFSQTRNPVPYYGSYASFLRTLRGLKEHGIPKRITARSLAPILGEEAPRIGTGLTSMGWVDEGGIPSEDFKKLVEAYGGTSWKEALSNVVQSAYSFIPNGVDDASEDQLHKAFLAHTGREVQVLKSAETFFLALALECGMPMSDKLYLRAARAHSEAKRIKIDDPELNVHVAQEPKRAPKISAEPAKGSEASEKTLGWIVEQIMNLTALIDDSGMTSKERDAVRVLLSYLQRLAAQAGKGTPG